MSFNTPTPQQAETIPLPASDFSAQAVPPAGVSVPVPAAAPAPTPYGAPAVAMPPSKATTLGATNTFALLSIVLAFISPIAAIVFGHMALSQIKRNGDAGRGIALTGTILGYAYFAVIGILVVLYVGMIVVMFGAMATAYPGFDNNYDF